jgi:hypothetical protein
MSGDHEMPRSMRDWLAGVIGELGQITQISTSNNLVWRVDGPDGRYTAKYVIDKSSGFRSEHELLRSLSGHDCFRPSLAIRELPDGGAFVLTPYLPGVSLDQVLLSSRLEPAQVDKLVDCWQRIMGILRSQPANGFGALYAPGGPSMATWPGYLLAQLEEQRIKGPKTALLYYSKLRSAMTSVDDQLAECVTPALVPADSNNRNFLVAPDGRLVCINLPALWHGHWLKPWGEALVHWDGTALADRVFDLMREHTQLLHFYAAHQAYIILVFGERFSPPPLERLQPWGGRRPLMDILDDHLAKL